MPQLTSPRDPRNRAGIPHVWPPHLQRQLRQGRRQRPDRSAAFRSGALRSGSLRSGTGLLAGTSPGRV